MSQQAAVAADALHTPADQVRVNRHRADWRGWKFMWPFALVFVFIVPIFAVCCLFPFVSMLINATKTQSDFTSAFGLGFGKTFALWDNIVTVFTYDAASSRAGWSTR